MEGHRADSFNKDKIRFLLIDEVINIQSSTLPNSGKPNLGALEGALARIDHFCLYDESAKKDIFVLAAFYLIAIAKAHAFNDANKRTAFQAATVFLLMNGVSLNDSPLLVKLTVWAAMDKAQLNDVAVTLKLLSDLNELSDSKDLEPTFSLLVRTIAWHSVNIIDQNNVDFISRLVSDEDDDLIKETTINY